MDTLQLFNIPQINFDKFHLLSLKMIKMFYMACFPFRYLSRLKLYFDYKTERLLAD